MNKNIEFKSMQSEIMHRLSKYSDDYDKFTNFEILITLKNFRILVNDIKIFTKNNMNNPNKHFIKNIENFVMNNKTTETLYCWYEFELAWETYGKYFWDGLIDRINHYIILYQEELNDLNNKKVKIFIDESGNTGQISLKNNKFNYGNDRYITLGMLVLDSEISENNFINKYKKFKEKFNIINELKGNDLLIKNNNDKLEYFLQNIVNTNFFAITLDKKYFICLEIMHLIYEPNKKFLPLKHFTAGFLVNENDDFFSQYIYLLENPKEDQFLKFINFLINYNYKENFKEDIKQIFISRLKFLLKNDGYKKLIKNIEKPVTNVKGKNFFHVANFDLILHGLDTIFNFHENPSQVCSITIYHDNIEELKFYIEEKINDFKGNFGINEKFELQFFDSKDNLLIQLTDNFTSIFNKLIKTILMSKNIDLNFSKNLWSIKKLSFLLNKIGGNNINSFFSVKDKSFIEGLLNLNDNLFDLNIIKEKINIQETIQLESFRQRINQSVMLDLLNLE